MLIMRDVHMLVGFCVPARLQERHSRAIAHVNGRGVDFRRHYW
jgi:hypothetical protein